MQTNFKVAVAHSVADLFKEMTITEMTMYNSKRWGQFRWHLRVGASPERVYSYFMSKYFITANKCTLCIKTYARWNFHATCCKPKPAFETQTTVSIAQSIRWRWTANKELIALTMVTSLPSKKDIYSRSYWWNGSTECCTTLDPANVVKLWTLHDTQLGMDWTKEDRNELCKGLT